MNICFYLQTFLFLEGVLDLKTLSNRYWAMGTIMKNAKYSLMSRCQNNSKYFSMEQKNEVHWKGTTFVKMFTRINIIVNAFLWNKK